MNKKKVLILVGSYLPGYRSGGPQRTVENLCEAFKNDVDFYILTRNHDFGSKDPYDVETGKWLYRYGIHIMYVTDKEFTIKLLRRMYCSFNLIYACGLFASKTIDILIVNRLFYRKGVTLYVAPMGVLEEGAFHNKYLKKKLFISLAKGFGLFKSIHWSFTSIKEKNDAIILLGMRNTNKYVIAEDLPHMVDFEYVKTRIHTKSPNSLKILFLSRICSQKNLLLCGDVLSKCEDIPVEFDIYGTKEDSDYWSRCKERFDQLPSNMRYKYCGDVNPNAIHDVFLQYDIFLLPTKSENYGHVIFEALSCGCIPVISDRTIWNDIEENKCGAVCNLDDSGSFSKAIIDYAIMDENEFYEYKKNAVNYAQKKYEQSFDRSGYRMILGLKKNASQSP